MIDGAFNVYDLAASQIRYSESNASKLVPDVLVGV